MTPPPNLETPESNFNSQFSSEPDEKLAQSLPLNEESNFSATANIEESPLSIDNKNDSLSDNPDEITSTNAENLEDEHLNSGEEHSIQNPVNSEEAIATIAPSEPAISEPTYYMPPSAKENTVSPVVAPSNSSEFDLYPQDYFDEIPDESEMSIFDHLEELRWRIFYSLIAVFIAIIGCFFFVNPIVELLEKPAQAIKFIQLAPGEYFFVSLKVAGYSGLIVAAPFILYQITMFVLPGLTRRERRLLGPLVLGSSVLFLLGLAFAYVALIPAALNFFISYGAEVVEQFFSIEKYFEFVLVLLFCTGIAFQIPVIQALLGALKIVSSEQMLAGWRYVILGGAILGAVLTPSTDPLTQSLLAGAVLGLYFGGIGIVKLIEKTQ